MSHKSVKDAIAARLAGDLPAVWVAVADFLPSDESRWPFAVVRTTSMTGSRATGRVDELRCTYRAEVVVGVSAPVADADEARAATTGDRDNLLQAVRDSLLWRRALAEGMRIPPVGHTEETRPSVQQSGGSSWIALGSIKFDVATVEAVTAPSGYVPPVPVTDVLAAEIVMHPANVDPFPPE